MTDVPFTELMPGQGGDKILNDSLVNINGAPATPSGVEMQRAKIGFGAAGDFNDVTTTQRLPVEVAFPATQPVSATALPLPSGAATAANQTAGNTILTTIANALAGTLGIGGSVVVTNFPAAQAVTGTVGISGTVPISAASLPLPAGAATAALQSTGNTTLASILTALGNPLAVSGPLTDAQLRAEPVPVSAAALPLPAGAATAAAQATGNASLANLDADVGAIDAAPAAANGTGNYSLIAAAKRALLNWADLLARIPAALGQTTMAQSLPVALASDQSALTVRPDNVQDSLTTSGSATGLGAVVSVPTAGFQGGSFQVTNAGTSCTITYEQSNDGALWVTLPVVNVAAVSNTVVTTSTAVGAFAFTSSLAFVRARVSTFGSGPVAVTLTQKRTVAPVTGVSLASSNQTIGTVGLSAGTNVVGNEVRYSGFTDSTTALGSSATFTGTGRALAGGTPSWTRFAATAFADQAGTLFVEQSLDSGATYQVIDTKAVSAGTAATSIVPVTGVAATSILYRVRYVNGGSAQGTFRLSSAFLAA